MFIKVKYGNDETLLCNPSCSGINLLKSIQKRTGFIDKSMIDLSDEKGLIQELEAHKYDPASNYLASHRTYILVEKQLLLQQQQQQQQPPTSDHGPQQQRSIPDEQTDSASDAGKYAYIPLLNNCLELFPDYRLQVQTNEVAKNSRAKGRTRGKATSPAGFKAKLEKKTTTTNKKRPV